MLAILVEPVWVKVPSRWDPEEQSDPDQANRPQLLSQDDNSIQDVQSTRTSPSKATTQPAGGGGARLDTATPQPERHVTTCNPYSNAGNSNGGYGARYQGKTSWADAVGDEDEEDPVDGEETPGDEPSGDNYMRPQAQAQRLHFERQCDRTIQLFNLAEGTTHADITSVVRGGMVLDIFLRAHERSATVSFLHSADAHAFLDHVRRHDLYLKNKRVCLSNNWLYPIADHLTDCTRSRYAGTTASSYCQGMCPARLPLVLRVTWSCTRFTRGTPKTVFETI